MYLNGMKRSLLSLLLFGREYPNLIDRYNMLGGALSLYGHPYGCSGAMLLIHCMAALEYCNGHYGLCAIAGAGGTGTAYDY